MRGGGLVLVVGVELIAWWVALAGGWLLLISSLTLADALLGVALAVPAAAAAVLARHALGVAYGPPRGLGRLLAVLPAAVVSDTLTLVRLLGGELRRHGEPPGGMRRISLAARGSAPADASWTALAAGGMSLSPGSYAVEADEGEHTVLVHALRPGPDVLDRAVRR